MTGFGRSSKKSQPAIVIAYIFATQMGLTDGRISYLGNYRRVVVALFFDGHAMIAGIITMALVALLGFLLEV